MAAYFVFCLVALGEYVRSTVCLSQAVVLHGLDHGISAGARFAPPSDAFWAHSFKSFFGVHKAK